MQYRTLGPDGLRVSAIGIGGRRLSDNHTETQNDDTRAQALIDRAIDLGVTLIDTADMYAETRNESLFGRLLAGGRRDKVVLATKFGFVRHDDGTRSICGRPDYVRQACEASLKRLQTDVIDLYYQHRVDPDTPIEETVGAMARLRDEGKIRHLGLSEAGPETLRRASAVHPISALQSDYSLWARDYEADTLPACKALGIGFVAYYPLGMGFLAGAIHAVDALGPKDSRRATPRLQDENIAHNTELLMKLKDIADEKGCKLSQLALAWILARGPDYVAIPGTSQIPHLEANAAAADVVLTAEDMARIDAIFPREGAVAGPRLARSRMAELNR
jgi:aryl-alcohol dehydrogenase-like predicted oxidoreductase